MHWNVCSAALQNDSEELIFFHIYGDWLTRLELNTLELRHLHNDLVMCYKIVFGLIDVDLTDIFTFSPSGVTRGHQFKLYKTRAEGARNAFFTNRVINVWNALSPDTVDFTSLFTFKHTISSRRQCLSNSVQYRFALNLLLTVSFYSIVYIF